MRRVGPAIYLETDGGGEIEIVLTDASGSEQRLPRTTPEQDLIHVTEVNFSVYRKEIRRLREEHSLFEKRLDISEADLEDLTAQVLALPELLREIDPVAYITVVTRLDAALQMHDDGSASFLLYAGRRQILALEEPIRTQVRLRNIFDVAFDEMERATQRERYEKLHSIYPATVRQHFLMR